jgi:hypothetical protein
MSFHLIYTIDTLDEENFKNSELKLKLMSSLNIPIFIEIGEEDYVNNLLKNMKIDISLIDKTKKLFTYHVEGDISKLDYGKNKIIKVEHIKENYDEWIRKYRCI